MEFKDADSNVSSKELNDQVPYLGECSYSRDNSVVSGASSPLKRFTFNMTKSHLNSVQMKIEKCSITES